MILSRYIEEEDRSVLSDSLSKDEYHKNTEADFFYRIGTACSVYEEDGKPIMFMRGTKAVRLDIQFVDNSDLKSNLKALIAAFETFVPNAKANGFTEMIFNSNSPRLIAFCKRRFGFHEVDGELRAFI